MSLSGKSEAVAAVVVRLRAREAGDAMVMQGRAACECLGLLYERGCALRLPSVCNR